MKVNKNTLWMVTVLSLIVFCDLASGFEYILPRGITMGMEAGLISRIRPNSFVGRNYVKEDASNNYDIIENYHGGVIGWFYIRSDKLAGYMLAQSLDGIDNSEADKRRKVLDVLSSEFEIYADAEVLRTDRKLNSFVTKAVLWRQSSTTLAAYSIHSPFEATVIIFDSAIMSQSDFFASPNLKQNFDNQVKAAQARVDGDALLDSKLTTRGGETPFRFSVEGVKQSSEKSAANEKVPIKNAQDQIHEESSENLISYYFVSGAALLSLLYFLIKYNKR